MNKEEKRFMAWLEKEMIHDCTFAVNPFDRTLEYCQFCGTMRPATVGDAICDSDFCDVSESGEGARCAETCWHLEAGK